MKQKGQEQVTYEARTGGGPWRRISPMRGESLDEVFRQLGPGAEVRQAQEAASGAGGVPDITSLAKQVERGARLLDGLADRQLGPIGHINDAIDRDDKLNDRLKKLEQQVEKLAGRVDAEAWASVRAGNGVTEQWARVEALEGRVSQLEAVREMGARTW